MCPAVPATSLDDLAAVQSRLSGSLSAIEIKEHGWPTDLKNRYNISDPASIKVECREMSVRHVYNWPGELNLTLPQIRVYRHGPTMKRIHAMITVYPFPEAWCMNDSYWAKKVGGMDIRVESINKRLDLEIRESMIQDCQRLWQGRGESMYDIDRTKRLSYPFNRSVARLHSEQGCDSLESRFLEERVCAFSELLKVG